MGWCKCVGCHVGRSTRHHMPCMRMCEAAVIEARKSCLPVEGHTAAPRFVRAIRLALDSEPPPLPFNTLSQVGGTIGNWLSNGATRHSPEHSPRCTIVGRAAHMFADQPTGLIRTPRRQPALNLKISQPAYPPPLGRIEGRMVAGWDGGGAHDAPVRSASLVLAPTERGSVSETDFTDFPTPVIILL